MACVAPGNSNLREEAFIMCVLQVMHVSTIKLRKDKLPTQLLSEKLIHFIVYEGEAVTGSKWMLCESYN